MTTELVPIIKDLMKKIGVQANRVDALEADLPLASQGVDSIDFPLTVIAIEHHFQIKLPEEELLRIRTLNDFALLVARLGASGPKG